MTKRAAEKHISAILPELGLIDNAVDVSRRVTATLVHLAASGRDS